MQRKLTVTALAADSESQNSTNAKPFIRVASLNLGSETYATTPYSENMLVIHSIEAWGGNLSCLKRENVFKLYTNNSFYLPHTQCKGLPLPET
jgi:hypothetical protein